MTILIIDKNNFTYSKFRKSLIDYLVKSNLKVNVAYSDTLFLNNDKSINKLIDISKMNLLVFFKYLYQLFILIKVKKPNVIHCFTIKPIISILILNIYFKKKIFLTFTGLGHIFINSSGLIYFLIKLFLKIFIKKEYIIFFQNIHDLDLFVRNKIVKKEQCKLVPGSGFDKEDIILTNNKVTKKKNFINILMIARFIKEKGIVEFVEASIKINKYHKNIQFSLLTTKDTSNPSSLSDNYKDYIVSNNIEVIEDNKNIYQYIENSDLIIQASYREGLSRVILEAASLKKPVLASNVPGNTDALEVLKNGKLFEVKNINSLCEGIQYFLRNRNEFTIFGENGYNNLYYFSKKNVFEVYANEYSKLLK